MPPLGNVSWGRGGNRVITGLFDCRDWKFAACHTAKVDGYFIEGHVPATDIKRLLDEKPDAIGLTVPGMPVGGPGMEQGTRFDKYDVLLVKKDGTTEVFASH